MTTVSSRLLALAQIATLAVSSLVIAVAVAFGAMAIAIAGLIIGLMGGLMAFTRPKLRARAVTLTARRSGRGWVIDPTER